MRRLLILLFVAILIGVVGFAVHQKSLEALGLVIALVAIALFIWSSVNLSLQVRPPTTTHSRVRPSTTTRSRVRRMHIPHIWRRGRPGMHTEELHSAIFQDPQE